VNKSAYGPTHFVVSCFTGTRGNAMKWFPFVGRTAWGLLNTPLTAGSSGGGVGMRPPTSLLPTLLILRTGTQNKVVEDDNQVAFVGAE